MMRSLWTGASGMTGQQLNVDVISNNIANVNTTGYKKERAEFQTLLYQTMAEPSPSVDNNIIKPNPMQVGLGVKPVAISRVYTTGNMQKSDSPLDFALSGPGFFVVQKGDKTLYTKDGSFKLSKNLADDNLTLTTSDGYPVLDTTGSNITIPAGVTIKVGQTGELYQENASTEVDLGVKLNVVQFSNPNGLDTIGQNLYQENISSGAPINESDGTLTKTTDIEQGFLEMSNVNVADEMVNLIVAQRAYELNSKSITTSDEMLQTANNLKR